MRKWLLLAALACGCAVVDQSATPARVFGVSALDGAIMQDGAADAAEAAPDGPFVDVAMDVQGDQPGDVVVTNDALDGGSDATAPDADAAPPAETGVDAGDGSLGPDNGPDVVMPDVQPDRADVVMGADVIDAGPDALDAADVPADNGLDALDVVTPDVPVDTGPGPCPTGQSRCGGECVNTQNDNSHCGGCGRVCSLSTVCSGGACGSICSPSEQRCSDTCVDTRSSTAHCGGCDNACPTPANASAVCASSVCDIGVCNEGFANCDGSASNGCEVDTRTSRTNCGMCGRTCTFANAAASCAASACVMGACNAGFGNCDSDTVTGCETLLMTSVANCGVCGNRCATGQSCVSGTCACPSGQSVCSGTCISTQTDVNNCGACGNICPTRLCSAGVCAAIVPPRLDVSWDTAQTDVRGFDVRVSNVRDNAVGVYRRTLDPAMRACLAGAEAVTNGCRINVREQVIPGTTTPITEWTSSMWTMELVLLRSDGSSLCTDATCGGRWNASTRIFTGLTVRCANSGARVPLPALDFDFAFGSSTVRVLGIRRTSVPGPAICEE